MTRYNNDPELTECVCSNLKQGVATLQDDIRPLTQQVLTLSLVCYRSAPQAAALELCKQFFIMYGREQSMVEPLRQLLGELVTIAMNTIRSSPTLSDHADLIDVFYATLAQVLKKQSGH